VLRLLGWSVGIPGNVFPKLTFSEAAGMADALGLGSIEGFSRKRSDVRSSLTELPLKMPAYHLESIGADDAARRKVFDFAKSLEVETIVSAGESDLAAE
jgi:hypothetical protein